MMPFDSRMLQLPMMPSGLISFDFNLEDARRGLELLTQPTSELGVYILRREFQKVYSMLDSDKTFKPSHNGVSVIYLAVANEIGEEALQKLSTHPCMQNAINDLGDDQNHSALHQAIIQSDSVAIKLLLESKADVNVSTKNGFTALHRVAQTSDEMLPVAQWLFDKGLSTVNAKNTFDRTALFEHMHCRKHNLRRTLPNQWFISLMVANGADIAGVFDESISNTQNHQMLRTAILEGQTIRAKRVNGIISKLLGVRIVATLVNEYDKEHQDLCVVGQLPNIHNLQKKLG